MYSNSPIESFTTEVNVIHSLPNLTTYKCRSVLILLLRKFFIPNSHEMQPVNDTGQATAISYVRSAALRLVKSWQFTLIMNSESLISLFRRANF